MLRPLTCRIRPAPLRAAALICSGFLLTSARNEAPAVAIPQQQPA